MYESFYNLRTKPFALLPDSDFLYPGSTHRAAYSILEYGLIHEAPFLVLTGDPGMGKTSLLQKLISEHGEKHSIGLVTNARYDIEHLLPWILLSLGLSKKRLDPVEAYHLFSEFLIQGSKQHRRVILIIDEAQSLGAELLEELRLLSNLNDGKTLKLQIILSGQPDLHTLLQRIDMTQFAQRIVVDYHLEPLSEAETGHCIRHRLQVAGGHPSLFTNKACALVHRLTRGNPRLINQVCDVALTYGFAEQERVITSKLVAQAAFDRNKGGILPLAAREELSALASAPEDATEIDSAPPQPSSPQPRPASPSPERTATRSVGTPESLYAKGVAMRKEGRLRDAIDMLELAGKSLSYMLKAQAQIGLCHRSLGDHGAAIQAFRAALNGQSASRNEVIDVQYFLARTLESMEQIAEAITLYRRIAQMNPRFKDAAYRAKELSSRKKSSTNGKRGVACNRSWFGNAIESLNQLIGSRK
ncbi:MAG TPA: AAA family ATPase [Nitrospiraceae bacterium]|jgi:type II secretory pathway predicted ATPase ExeA|nr:AAA family ATPase [Nitrospiraceae bacterium]